MPKPPIKPTDLDPNAYDAQMLLLDMYLGNVRFSKQKLSRKPNRKLTKYEKNVPIANFSNINQIMQLNMNKNNIINPKISHTLDFLEVIRNAYRNEQGVESLSKCAKRIFKYSRNIDAYKMYR